MSKKVVHISPRFAHHSGVVRGRSEMSRSTGFVTCPWCGTEVECYLWSLAGGGKKCPCCHDTILSYLMAFKRGCIKERWCILANAHDGDCQKLGEPIIRPGVNLKKTRKKR